MIGLVAVEHVAVVVIVTQAADPGPFVNVCRWYNRVVFALGVASIAPGHAFVNMQPLARLFRPRRDTPAGSEPVMLPLTVIGGHAQLGSVNVVALEPPL